MVAKCGEPEGMTASAAAEVEDRQRTSVYAAESFGDKGCRLLTIGVSGATIGTCQ